MSVYKSGSRYLEIGYFISFIMCILWFSILYAVVAALLYPLTIILRAIGWYSLAKKFEKELFYLTSDVVLVLGSTICILTFLMYSLKVPFTLHILVILWVIYSLVEIVSYLQLSRYSVLFYASLFSIIGIIVVIYFVFYVRPSFIWTFLIISNATPFLILSSFSSFFGFFQLHEAEVTTEPATVMSTPD